MKLLIVTALLIKTVSIEQVPHSLTRGDAALFKIRNVDQLCELSHPQLVFESLGNNMFMTVVPIDAGGPPMMSPLKLTVMCEDMYGILPLKTQMPKLVTTRIRVPPKTLTWPDSIQREIDAQRREWSKYLDWVFPTIIPAMDNTPVIMPVHGKLTSKFFSPRVYNDGKIRRHYGTDLSVGNGTTLLAPMDGIVVLNQKHHLKGNVLLLHHGGGLMTSYFHLSRIDVSPGQWVKKSQVLGASGKTGRVTGPHLHWEAYWYGFPFNALSLIDLNSPKHTVHSIGLTQRENVAIF